MRKEQSKTRWMILMAILLMTPVLAGCFGGDDAPKTTDDDTGDANVKKSTGGGSEKKETPKNTDHSGAKNDPTAHFHHYWGDPPRESVVIYDGKVEFNNYDTKYILSHNTMAWAEFNLETDNDDVGGQDSDPVSGESMADTVFAGTNRIEVTFPSEFPPGVSSMRFQYKPSNTPIYFPPAGITVFPGQIVSIALDEEGMSDPPHQFTTSRWSFRLFAANEVCHEYGLEPDQCPPAFINQEDPNPEGTTTYTWGARGSGMKMVAYNGGQKSLDPPHPDFWKDGDVRDMGTVDGTVTDPSVQTPVFRERISSMTDIQMDPNNIVPLGTDYVQVKVKWDNTAPTAEHLPVFLKLYYHGANTIEYSEAEAPTQEGEWWVYKIYDESGALVDPPYESNSFWRFKLVPVTDLNGEAQEKTGIFSGDWQMQFSAHKKENFVLT